MKKFLFLIIATLSCFLSSCEDDELVFSDGSKVKIEYAACFSDDLWDFIDLSISYTNNQGETITELVTKEDCKSDKHPSISINLPTHTWVKNVTYNDFDIKELVEIKIIRKKGVQIEENQSYDFIYGYNYIVRSIYDICSNSQTEITAPIRFRNEEAEQYLNNIDNKVIYMDVIVDGKGMIQNRKSNK